MVHAPDDLVSRSACWMTERAGFDLGYPQVFLPGQPPESRHLALGDLSTYGTETGLLK
jgi:hypothetical protein